MPMTPAGLSAAIKTEIEGVLTIDDEEQLVKVSDAMAKAVVEYIQANALVTLNNGADSGGDVLVDLTGSIS